MTPTTRDVVIFSTADWDARYWTNKQHNARHFEKLGYRVLYVETVGLRAPTLDRKDIGRMLARLRRGVAPPRRVSERIWVLSPLAVPFGHHVPAVRLFNQGWLRRRVASFLRRHGMRNPLIWTYHPYVLETISGFAHGSVIYHCVDDLAAVPGVDAKAFDREESRLLKQADVVFTTSAALEEKCRRGNPNTHFFPNVVDYEHFSKARQPGPLPEDLARIPEPRIGYLGVLSDYKVDFALLLEAVTRRPDWSWVFIGSEREGQQSAKLSALRACPNAYFLGYRGYDALPLYLRGLAVGLIPSLVNDYTRSMFPMKYFEYLAAGVPVVATPLDFTLSEPRCVVAADARSLVSAIDALLPKGKLSERESREAVAGNTWTDRLRAMLSLIPGAA